MRDMKVNAFITIVILSFLYIFKTRKKSSTLNIRVMEFTYTLHFTGNFDQYFKLKRKFLVLKVINLLCWYSWRYKMPYLLGKRKKNVIAKYFVRSFLCARWRRWKRGCLGLVKGFELWADYHYLPAVFLKYQLNLEI